MNRCGESGKRTAGYRSPGETGPENGYRKCYCSAITKNIENIEIAKKMLDNASTVCYSFIVCRTVRFSRIP